MTVALLLLACGSAPAQVVKVLNSQRGGYNRVAPDVNTVTLDLNDNTTVLVVGLYGDGGPDINGHRNMTFGGVPPTGLMTNGSTTRAAMAYWVGPNTAAGQTLAWNYTADFVGYYWTYELSNVATNIAAIRSGNGLTMTNSTITRLTTVTNKTLVISYISANNSAPANQGFTANTPFVQDGVTIANAGAGASMAAALYTPTLPELVTNSWTVVGGWGPGNTGLGAMGFTPLNIGAPIVSGSIFPDLAAPSDVYTVTVVLDPFRYGTVTNVNIDLTSIGGTAVNALVQTASTNVYTNTFTLSGSAPIGTNALPVTVQQDAAPYTGTNPVSIVIATAAAPVLARDTRPTAPGPFYVYTGQGVTFSALFSAPGVVTLNWQKSTDGVTFTDIPGANSSSYTIPSAVLGDAGYYQLKCANFLGTVYSTPVQVLVVPPPAGSIIWSAPISHRGLTADQILNTNTFPAGNKVAGALMAQNGGAAVTVALTGKSIVFAPANTSWAGLSDGNTFTLNVNTNNTGNNNFNDVLNRGYNNTDLSQTITLTNLEVGQQYQLQLFALDNRPGLTPAGSLQFTTFGDSLDPNQITSAPFAMADSSYMLGTFTASSPSLTIQQNLLDSAGNFNALVLRTVGWTNAPYFTSQPRDTNFFAGGRVGLTGTAATDSTVSSTITYQWANGPVGGPYTDLANGAKYVGVTTTSLIISNLVGIDAIPVYVLKATAGGKTRVSREARVYVQPVPPAPIPASFANAVLALTNIPNSRLAGFWRLNELEDPSTGTLLAQDASGRGRHGIYGSTAQNKFNSILSPQPPTYNGFASGEGALRTGAAGTSDGTSVITLPALNTTASADMTILMWVNPAALAGANSGLFFSRGTVQGGFGFYGNTGGPSGQRNIGYFWPTIGSASTFAYNSGLFPVNDIWNLVALVIRTNSATFYLNYVDTNGAFFGKAVDPAANVYATNTFADGPIWLGGDPLNNGANIVFPGRISSAAVFNSALNDDQIYDLFVAAFQNAGFPASILQQPPATVTNYVGYTVQLNAVAGGSKPITNQWKFNGTDLVDGWFNGSLIVGSKSNVLTIHNIQTYYQGVYTLSVTNALGGAVSSNANVYIQTPQPPPPAGNLLGQWFNGAASLANQSSLLPGVHNAYGVGASATNYFFTNGVPPGKSGVALALIGGGTSMGISNTWVSDPGYVDTFDAGISTSFSVMTWARGQPGVWNPFVSKGGEDPEGWQLRRSAGQNAVFTVRGSGAAADPAGDSGGSGADGQWHLYVGTFDANTLERALYVDGVLRNLQTGNNLYTVSTGARLVIGGRSLAPDAAITGGANFTGGSLYDVRIYNVALTGAQQASLFTPAPLPVQKITVAPGAPGQLVLSWTPGGTLLQSTNVIGPWVTNLTAVSPYTVLTTNFPGQFYRIILQ